MKKTTAKTKVSSRKPKASAAKKAEVKRKKHLFNFVVNREERRQIKRKANKYTRGNSSAWVKYAALKHDVPAKLRRDLVCEQEAMAS